MGGLIPIEDMFHPLLRHYLDAPAWLKASAGWAYSRLPERVRLGNAYYVYREELAHACQDGQAVKLQAARRLRENLRWAFETVPAYRDYHPLLVRDEAPQELLARLPVIGKLDIKSNPERYLSQAMPDSRRLTTFTGGSTRTPMRFYLQKYVTRAKEYAFIRNFRSRLGADGHELTLALRGRTVRSASRPQGRLWMREPIKGQLVLSADHLEERYMARYAEALLKFRPEFIEAFPSALYPLARWLNSHPLPDFTAAVKGVMLYSENVYGFQMRAFRNVFRCPVLKHYGHSERVLMAASMPDDDRYFFWPQYGWLELLDFEDKPITRPGILGQIVGTSFDNQVMPFVRYRTGDLAMLCGTEHPKLPGYTVCERIEGRLQEFVVCRDRRLVSVTTLGAAHFPALADVEAIQYEQHRPGEVTLKFVATSPPPPTFRERVAAAIRKKTQGGCEVHVVQVDHIDRTPRGKRHMLIQKLDISRYLGAATSL